MIGSNILTKKPDILFVYPPTGWTRDAMSISENDSPPLGLMYVAAAARQSGLTVTLVDMNHPPLNVIDLASIIEKQKPQIIAFSVFTPSFDQVKRILKMIKDRFPSIYLIAGGVHSTVLPFDMIKVGVDCVVIGEGEATIVELAKKLLSNDDLSAVPGIIFNKDSSSMKKNISSKRLEYQSFSTQKRNPSQDLDILPWPTRDLIQIQKYGQPGAICASRGCPYCCSFCSSVLSGGHKHRLRSVDNVMNEISDLQDRYGIMKFQFLDDNFAAVPNNAEALTSRLRGHGYKWSCQTSVMELMDNIDLITRMYEAGCREIYFGLESGSRRLLYQYKSIDPERALAVLKHATTLGKNKGKDALQTVVGFMVGHPLDDEESIEETIRFALSLRNLGIDTMIGIMQPYPGSLIFREPNRYGIKIENFNYEDYLYPKANMSTMYLSRQQISHLYSNGLLRIMETY